MEALTLLTIALGAVPTLYLIYLSLLPHPLPGIPYRPSSARSLLGDIPALLTHLSTHPTNTFTTYTTSLMRQLDSPVIQIFPRPRFLSLLPGISSVKPKVVVLGDYATAYDVFVRRSREFDRSPSIGNMLLGFIPRNHIHLRTNGTWKAQRRLLLGAMGKGFLFGVLAPVIGERAERLVDVWKEKGKLAKERPWSAQRDLYLLALSGVAAFTFGGQFEEGLEKEVGVGREEPSERSEGEGMPDGEDSDQPVEFPEQDIPDIFRASLEITRTMGELRGSLMPRVKWEIVRRRERLKWARTVMADTVNREIAKAVEKLDRSREATPECAVEHMVAHERNLAMKEGRRPDYFSPVMVDEITGFMIATYETTGSTLCWGFKYLTDLPSIQNKLRHALEKGYPAALKERRSPTIEEMNNTDIPYLDAVSEEILRFANPATGVDRQAVVDTEILGHAVPKGTIVACLLPEPALISPPEIAKNLSQRSSSINSNSWDDSDLAHFRPERWILHGEFDLDAAPRVAFGLGPRGCPGKRLAYMEIKAGLVSVLWNFELLPCPAELSGYEKLVLATQKPKQCYVRLREISRSWTL
ncbi:cytochrome P450 [Aspergillus pseudoustus]|uniref:Cytochrome P450 n=1 Tax=Aspergillus pseudoustus TaxID=1810923 RepID=A0ABR4KFQ7_9EURO